MNLVFVFESNAQTKPIQFYVTDIEPWGYSENGIAKGILVDMSLAIIKEAGLPANIMLAPLARILRNFELKKNVASIQFASEHLSRFADKSGEVIRYDIGIHPPKGVELSSIEDLNGKIICQIRGGHYGTKYDNYMKAKKYKIKTYKQAIKMMFNQKCDAVVGVTRTVIWTANVLGYGRENFSKTLKLKNEIGFLFLSNTNINDKMKQKLRQATNKLREQGVFEQITSNYLSL